MGAQPHSSSFAHSSSVFYPSPPMTGSETSERPGTSGRGCTASGAATPSSAPAASASTSPNTIPPPSTAALRSHYRPHVLVSCVPCKNAHVKCQQKRPCERCVKRGIQPQCVDVVHKERGRPPKESKSAKSSGPPSSDGESGRGRSYPVRHPPAPPLSRINTGTEVGSRRASSPDIVFLSQRPASAYPDTGPSEQRWGAPPPPAQASSHPSAPYYQIGPQSTYGAYGPPQVPPGYHGRHDSGVSYPPMPATAHNQPPIQHPMQQYSQNYRGYPDQDPARYSDARTGQEARSSRRPSSPPLSYRPPSPPVQYRDPLLGSRYRAPSSASSRPQAMEPTANLDPSRDHRGIELFRAPPPMTRRSILSEEEYSSLTLPPLVSPEAHRQPTYPGPTSDSRSAPTSAPSQRYSSTSYADTNADYSRQHRSAHNTRHPEPSTTEHRQLPSLQRSNSTNTSSSPYPSQYYQRPSSAHGSNTNAYSTTRYADGPGGTPTTSRPHHHRRHSPPPLSYRAPRTITPPPVRHYPALMPATSSHARSSSRQRSSSAQRGTAQATAGTQARVGSVGPRSPPRIREERTAERAAVPPSVAATRTYAERGSSSSESLKSSGGFGGAGGVGGPAGSSSASRRRQSSPKRRRIGIRELVD